MENLPGKGNFEHKLYQHMIFEKVSGEGVKADKEKKTKGGSKLIDVLAYPNGEKEFVPMKSPCTLPIWPQTSRKTWGTERPRWLLSLVTKKTLRKPRRWSEKIKTLSNILRRFFLILSIIFQLSWASSHDIFNDGKRETSKTTQ